VILIDVVQGGADMEVLISALAPTATALGLSLSFFLPSSPLVDILIDSEGEGPRMRLADN
jgi:hypothetical protein